MGRKVTKQVMADTLARRVGMSAGDIRKVIDELFGKNGSGGSIAKPGLIHQWVAYGYDVVIPGFAKFSRGKLGPRSFANPMTGERHTTPTRWRARVQIFGPFSEYVNNIVQAHWKTDDKTAE